MHQMENNNSKCVLYDSGKFDLCESQCPACKEYFSDILGKGEIDQPSHVAEDEAGGIIELLCHTLEELKKMYSDEWTDYVDQQVDSALADGKRWLDVYADAEHPEEKSIDPAEARRNIPADMDEWCEAHQIYYKDECPECATIPKGEDTPQLFGGEVVTFMDIVQEKRLLQGNIMRLKEELASLKDQQAKEVRERCWEMFKAGILNMVAKHPDETKMRKMFDNIYYMNYEMKPTHPGH